MATLDDVRKIAMELPGTIAADDGLAYSVVVKGKPKGYVWAWNEKVHPKRPKVRNPDVLATMVGSLSEKDLILGSDPTKFFTEPHYNGFPAVLIRLSAITPEELADYIVEAWRAKASPKLIAEYEATLG